MDFQTPEIKTIDSKKLIGKRQLISLYDNKVAELWRSFLSSQGKISGRINADLISMSVYPETYSFVNFDPTAMFEKWACAEVDSLNNIPDGFDSFHLPAGEYAVFLYKGNPQEGAAFFEHIFTRWLPMSLYELDQRPHFEVIGEKYKNNDPESEEEIWIPVRLKS